MVLKLTVQGDPKNKDRAKREALTWTHVGGLRGGSMRVDNGVGLIEPGGRLELKDGKLTGSFRREELGAVVSVDTVVADGAITGTGGIGDRKWMVATRMAGVSMILAPGRLVIEGAQPGQAGKRGVGSHVAAALNTATGKPVWMGTAHGSYTGRGQLLRLTRDRIHRDVLLTRAWEAIDATSGKPLLRGASPDQWDWEGVWQDGDTLYSTYENGSAAIRYWLDADGQVGSRTLWTRRRLHAFVAGGPGGTLSDGRLL